MGIWIINLLQLKSFPYKQRISYYRFLSTLLYQGRSRIKSTLILCTRRLFQWIFTNEYTPIVWDQHMLAGGEYEYPLRVFINSGDICGQIKFHNPLVATCSSQGNFLYVSNLFIGVSSKERRNIECCICAVHTDVQKGFVECIFDWYD